MTSVELHNKMNNPVTILTTHTGEKYKINSGDYSRIPHTEGDIVAFNMKNIEIARKPILVPDYETNDGPISESFPLLYHYTLPVNLTQTGELIILKKKK
jgi:hypothetical protein